MGAMNDERKNQSVLRWASTAAGLLLATLCAMTALGGVSQQRFEWVAPAADYAAALVAQANGLRALVAVDDLFIASYVIATLALAQRIARGRWSALPVVVALFGLVAGVLDLHENHQLLAMTRAAELGGTLSDASILERSELSQLKWMLGHVAFAMVGAAWPSPRSWLDRLLVVSLIAVQLPIGALTWTLTDPSAVEVAIWARYASFLSGFAVIAWMARPHPDAPSATATGAPA